jgi:hypothetical protein
MGNKLYVGNLPYSVRDSDLEQAFGQFGSVTSAKVMMERDTGRSKGFGFVEMGSDAEAQAAIQWHERPAVWVAAVSSSTKRVPWKPVRRAVAALASAVAADMAAVVAAATVAVAAAVAVKAVAAATAAVVVVAAVETAASVAPMAPARAVGAMAVAAVAVAAAATKNKRLLREPFLCLLLSLKRLRQVGSFRARQALASGTGP